MKWILSIIVFTSLSFSFSQSDSNKSINIFYNPEFMPSYPGGEDRFYKFIDSLLVYPQSEELVDVYGSVYIGFTIEVDGSLSNFEVKRTIHELFSKEALRVCKLMPKWNPGGYYSNGKKVFQKTKMVMPFKFTKRLHTKSKVEKGIWLDPIGPGFPGGDEKRRSFIQLVKHYPDSAKAKGIEGKVFIQFLVGKKGKLSNLKILRSPDTLLSQEAIQIVNLMPDWIPGTNHNGDSVEVKITMPIEFKINREPIFNNVDSMPEFPGGEVKLFEYLGKNFKLTQLENGQIFFSYYFEFIVEKDGSTSNLRVLKNHSDILYKDVALFFYGMPMWSPGLHNGKPVRTKMVLPIRIHLR